MLFSYKKKINLQNKDKLANIISDDRFFYNKSLNCNLHCRKQVNLIQYLNYLNAIHDFKKDIEQGQLFIFTS